MKAYHSNCKFNHFEVTINGKFSNWTTSQKMTVNQYRKFLSCYHNVAIASVEILKAY